jgi:hypothetical protein
MLPTKFRIFWPSGFREEELKKLANQKQESSFRSNSFNKHGRHRRFLFLIGLFLKISSETAWPNDLKLGKIDQSETRIACGGHVC